MIDTKEVRIGNIVAAGVVPVTIRGIHTRDISSQHDRGHFYVDGFVGKHYCLNDYDLDGIPLTEEWLVKMGFTRTVTKFPLLDYVDYRQGNCVASLITEGIEIEYCGLDIEERTYIRRINHVHELQNMWMALTGHELTIKTDI